MRIKTRNILFLATTITVIIALIILTPFVLNYRRIFQIGYYYNEEQNSIYYPLGKGIIYSKVNLDYVGYENRYDYNLQVLAGNEGNIIFNGFLSIEGEILINDKHYKNIYDTFAIPINQILKNFDIWLDKNDIAIINLNITAQFREQTQIHNETVSVSLSSLVKYNNSDIGNITVSFIWVDVLFFSSFIVMPLISFLIFRPVFGLKDSDIDSKRNQRFHDYISYKAKWDED